MHALLIVSALKQASMALKDWSVAWQQVPEAYPHCWCAPSLSLPLHTGYLQVHVDSVMGHALVGLTTAGLVRRPGRGQGQAGTAAAVLASGVIME